ncbi:hypothetical protein L1887_53238 [Cichorium endivia]|nr:hypothetical protein L1887_53238 [Cichorium endivia]
MPAPPTEVRNSTTSTLGTEAAPHTAHLESDDAGADDDHLLGHLLELERAGGADDLLLVDLDAGEGRHLGAGGDEDVLGLHLGLAAVVEGDLDGGGAAEATGALEVVDLVLLEEALDTLVRPVTALDLALSMVSRHVPPSEPRFSRHRRLEAKLRSLDGGDVATGATTDDDEIVRLSAGGEAAALDAGQRRDDTRKRRGLEGARRGGDRRSREQTGDHGGEGVWLSRNLQAASRGRREGVTECQLCFPTILCLLAAVLMISTEKSRALRDCRQFPPVRRPSKPNPKTVISPTWRTETSDVPSQASMAPTSDESSADRPDVSLPEGSKDARASPWWRLNQSPSRLPEPGCDDYCFLGRLASLQPLTLAIEAAVAPHARLGASVAPSSCEPAKTFADDEMEARDNDHILELLARETSTVGAQPSTAQVGQREGHGELADELGMMRCRRERAERDARGRPQHQVAVPGRLAILWIRIVARVVAVRGRGSLRPRYRPSGAASGVLRPTQTTTAARWSAARRRCSASARHHPQRATVPRWTWWDAASHWCAPAPLCDGRCSSPTH